MTIKLVETMAYRISVLGAPLRGVQYPMTERQTGLFVAKGKAECIAEAVMKALIDGELARIAANAKAPVDGMVFLPPSRERLKKRFLVNGSANYFQETE